MVNHDLLQFASPEQSWLNAGYRLVFTAKKRMVNRELTISFETGEVESLATIFSQKIKVGIAKKGDVLLGITLPPSVILDNYSYIRAYFNDISLKKRNCALGHVDVSCTTNPPWL